MFLRILTLSLIGFPSLVQASVLINEVAWMGSSESANHEWIELHNTGPVTDLDGWVLHDANNLTIELSGTIAANDYVVLERTSDTSAPGVAFMIYTGALSNTGATLVLRDADGVVIDQVAGGADWENIGGDNTAKQTAQRTATGWVTADSTPGIANSTANTPVDDADNTADGTELEGSQMATNKPSGSNSPTILTLPDISLQLDLQVPATTYVGQPTEFTVEPSGVGSTIEKSLQYEWSLGNGDTRRGQDITYTYMYPGEYVVVVSGEYKRQKQFTRQTVTVLPVMLALNRTKDGLYQVHNPTDQEIDLGHYRLVGDTAHTFPKHTIILPHSTIIIPATVSDNSQTIVALYNQSDQVVAMHAPGYTRPETVIVRGAVPAPLVSQEALVRPIEVVSQSASTQTFGFATDEIIESPLVDIQPDQTPVIQPTSTQLAAVAVPGNPLSDNWPLYALVSLLVLGTIGIYLVPQKSDSTPWL